MPRQSPATRDPHPDDSVGVLRAIVDASEDAVIGTHHGTITYWNRAAERLYGYSAAQALGESIAITSPTQEGLADFEAMEDAIGRDETITQEYTIRRRTDGALIDVSLSVAPLHDAEGRVCGSSTIVRDITVRRRAERERDDSRRLLAEAQSLARLGSFELDLDSGRLTHSDQFREIFGLTDHVLPDGDRTVFHQLIHPGDRDRHVAMLDDVARTGEPAVGEVRITDTGGHERIVQTRARRDDATRPRIVGTLQDVSEARALQREVDRANAAFAAVLNAATQTAILATDRDGLITVFNRGAELMFGYPSSEMVGRHTTLVLHDPREVAERAAELGVEPGLGVFTATARDGSAETRTWTMVRKDGRRLPVSLTLTAQLSATGAVVGVTGIARDISDALTAEQARAAAERRFLAAFEHAPNGMALIGLQGLERGLFVRSNVTFARMLGFDDGDDLEGRAIAELTFADDVQMSTDAFARLLAGETTTQEKRYLSRDGEPVWTLVRTTPIPSQDGSVPEYAVSQIVDLRERKRLEERLRELADRDELTGLDNRRRFSSELGRLLAEARRQQDMGALLVVDLDGFKLVNDTGGHAAGDALLIEVARLLRTTVRESDIVARIGGDEFAVILPHTDRAGARTLAEALRKTLARGTPVTASIGIACFQDHLGDADALVREADGAMYGDKHRARLRSATCRSVA